MTDRKIAFLGTGLMGAPMARRLLAAGFAVTVWNRDRSKADALAADGATVAATAVEAAKGATVLFTMLTNAGAVSEVLFGSGVAEALEPGAVVVDNSSIPPPLARENAEKLAERGVHHIDAPVSGGVVGAAAGTLAIMAGGDADVIDSVRDVLAPLGRVTRVGPSGAGQLAKLGNQQIVAVTIGAIAEAMLLVEAGGGSPEAFRTAIRGGFAESRILELHGQRMIERNFIPGGTSRNQLKDLDAVLAAAQSLSLHLPLTEAVRAEFAEFVEQGGGESDHSGLLQYLEDKNARGKT
ncbi:MULTISPECIES: NAD(P)-dependent oxidoreductase [unclassified Rhizobium]|uniref:NAD(P)-dependent oxidoreductase n=1 Tax=unclassified Rhizobium TaxID=2613769 RepID=UPI000CDF3572|nr:MULTISPECIES: NAD(P)-dependent oxidoreductase [Rhizobium]AVA22657.1 2-hydroxy-3-oxopropionate reductase 2 [Rhizobium sp. NXC24]MDK4738331.1 NAD(P)-dependent oxidoreductase [Rhizobium sp. CNPSo 3464]UWU20037.1 NAD(P)-dependent oxidoreductase [Rhizobium tropici]